jgi:carbonic anhydrase
VAGTLLLPLLAPRPAAAAGNLTPRQERLLHACSPADDPLAALLERNRRFCQAWQEAANAPTAAARADRLHAVWRASCQTDLGAMAQGQRPWAALLSCADSRVSPEWIFASGPGELFEVRCAGNTAFDDGIASLEYAVNALGVPLILVMGHSGCGAVTAAMDQGPLTPLLEQLVRPIRAALEPGDDLTLAIRHNAARSAAQLPQRSAVLREAVAAQRLRIEGAVFDIATGRVSLV